ncbi:GvpL/GvpF family gas vesicle protein [Microbispora rosea]|uniref:GvpL/GvpF family gas vesicle protein n=1 Tax=Microbispora rosea TaxID=58117 RepID=UPI00379DFB65
MRDHHPAKNHPAVSENHPGVGQGVYLYAVTPAGENGKAEASGTAGESGTAGASGTAGESGTAGASGTAGESGKAGESMESAERPPDLRGVMGGVVRPVPRGGLVAYVSDVPLDRFGEEPLRRSLEDLDWVEGVARAHHRVVEALAASGPTAPVRLVTVYTGEEQVRDLLDLRHDDFTEILSRVAGRREWGVKAYLRRDTPPPSPAPAATAAGGGDSPGMAYLRRKKESLRGREDLWRAAAERAELLHAELGRIAVASRRHRPQDPQLSGRSESMVLNGAYLVDPAREEEFAAVLDGYRDRFLDVELTGPWAPYSFTSIDLGAGRAGGVR